MKKFASLLLAVLMICAIIPFGAISALAETQTTEPSQTLTFSKKTVITAYTEKFKLVAYAPIGKEGWGNFLIEAKTEYRIKRIEAIAVNGGSDFENVMISSGEKREIASVSNGSTVHFDSIHSKKFTLTCNGASKFSSVTIFYEKCTYIDENKNTVDSPDTLCELTADTTTLTDGWYVVNSNVDFGNKRLEINGQVNLLLKDNCGITTSGGIHIKKLKSLNVYSESINISDPSKMGYIKVNGAPENCAGIGGNKFECDVVLNIIGGNIESHGGYDGAGIGSGREGNATVSIYNGFIRAWGGNGGAGIGSGKSGYSSDNDAFCAINIFDGYIEATGGSNGAGIGSGAGSFSHIVIHGGTVEAWGGYYGSGIGLGNRNEFHYGGSSVAISDKANVKAHGGFEGADITSVVRYTGSVLSEGSLIIIVGIAGLAVGFLVAMLIFKKKKKKPAVADGTDKTDEK